jgi:ATP-dependent Clp protease protease subunit
MIVLPIVTHRDQNSNLQFDIFSRLLKDRIIMLCGEINATAANLIIAQILHLESENNEEPIYMYINSPGGVVTSALCIYDVMKYVGPQIVTVCIGEACSCASLLFCAGDRRLIMPNARILLHQTSGGMQGQASDLTIYVKEMLEIQNILIELYYQNTGIAHSVIKEYFDRDSIFRGEQAVKIGLADEIVGSRAKLKKKGSYIEKSKNIHNLSEDNPPEPNNKSKTTAKLKPTNKARSSNE